MALRTQLTIFTPTYNRAYILPDLYISLCGQTDKSFTWMIVDDGSTDETEYLIRQWEDENRISISYLHQENGGKHVAHNTAIEHCTTPWIVCVDSDDRLTDNAVEIINHLIEEENDNEMVVGLVGPKCDVNENKIHRNWPKEKYIRFFDLYDKKGFKGETVLVFRTQIIREFSFPVFPGERYMPENVVYYKISAKGYFRTIDQVIYCFEYRLDGYTSNTMKMIINNPQGYLLSLKETVEQSDSLINRAKAYAYYHAIDNTLKSNHAFKLEENEISGIEKLIGLIYAPHYYIKMNRAIGKIAKNE